MSVAVSYLSLVVYATGEGGGGRGLERIVDCFNLYMPILHILLNLCSSCTR